MLTRLRLRKNEYHKWLSKKRRYLGRMYGKIPNRQLSEKFGVGKKRLEAVAARMGKTKEKAPNYSNWELIYIKKNYYKLPHKKIAQKLKRTVNGIEILAAGKGWISKT